MWNIIQRVEEEFSCRLIHMIRYFWQQDSVCGVEHLLVLMQQNMTPDVMELIAQRIMIH